MITDLHSPVNGDVANCATPDFTIEDGRMCYRGRPVADYFVFIIGESPTFYTLFFAGQRWPERSILRIPKKIFHNPQRLKCVLEAQSPVDGCYRRMASKLAPAILAVSGVAS